MTYNKKNKISKDDFIKFGGEKKDTELEWVVYSDYKIGNPNDNEESLVKRKLIEGLDKYIFKTPKSSKKIYYPLNESSNLFLSFTNIGKKIDFPSKRNYEYINNKKLINWVHKYGLLVNQVDIINGQEIMPLEYFYDEIINAKRLLSLYEQVIDKDYKTLKERILLEKKLTRLHVYLDNKDNFCLSYSAYPNDYNDNPYISKNDYYYIALNIIIEKVTTDYLYGNVSPSYKNIEHCKDDLNYPYKVIPSNICKDLLSAMYLQFYWFLTQKKPFSYCDFCGDIYELTTTKKRFCDDSCKGRYHYHKNKNKKGD